MHQNHLLPGTHCKLTAPQHGEASITEQVNPSRGHDLPPPVGQNEIACAQIGSRSLPAIRINRRSGLADVRPWNSLAGISHSSPPPPICLPSRQRIETEPQHIRSRLLLGHNLLNLARFRSPSQGFDGDIKHSGDLAQTLCTWGCLALEPLAHGLRG